MRLTDFLNEPKDISGVSNPTKEDVLQYFLFIRNEIFGDSWRTSSKLAPIFIAMSNNLSDSVQISEKNLQSRIERLYKATQKTLTSIKKPTSKKAEELKRKLKGAFVLDSKPKLSNDIPTFELESDPGSNQSRSADIINTKRKCRLSSYTKFFGESSVASEDSSSQFVPDSRTDLIPLPDEKLNQLLEYSIRFGLSNFACSKMITGACRDNSFTVTESMVRRLKDKIRSAKVESLTSLDVRAIYFDGKRTPSLMWRDGRSEEQVYEYITVVSYPGNRYLGCYVPSNGRAHSIAVCILNNLEEFKINTANIEVLGCDGTNVNVGYKDGICAHLQSTRFLNRACVISVCRLHSIEINFKRLFEFLDMPQHQSKKGKQSTTGPSSFAGPVGKLLSTDVWEIPIDSSFQFIHCPDFPRLRKAQVADLSNDQQYLYLMCCSIIDGHVPENLARRKISGLNHARWLTLACRILRCYVTKAGFSYRYTIETCTKYIITVYYKAHTDVKMHSALEYGAPNLFKEIQYIRDCDLTRKEREVVMHHVQINSYFGHPETVIVALLCDSQIENRRLGIEWVTKIRAKVDPNLPVRRYYKPRINEDSKSYHELFLLKEDAAGLFYWTDCSVPGWVRVHEPMITKKYSMEELEALEWVPLSTPFKCHSQEVESAVALTSQAVKKVVHKERKIGEALVIEASRK